MDHAATHAPPAATPTTDADGGTETDGRSSGSVNAAISDAVVHIYKEYMGRGPTKTRTSIRDDVVVVLLEDVLTRAEKTLVGEGELDAVMHMRRTVQLTMKDSLTDVVQDLTRRRVVAFMSDNHAEPDCAVEVFVLERPCPEDGHSGAQAH